MDKLNPTQVSHKLFAGELTLRKYTAGTSEVWKTFGVVVSEGEALDFVACFSCNQALQFKGRSTGTTSLKCHKCRIASNQPTIPVPSKVKELPSIPKKAPTPLHIKAAITDACVDFCTEDLRAFDTVAGPGFDKLVQEVSRVLL